MLVLKAVVPNKILSGEILISSEPPVLKVITSLPSKSIDVFVSLTPAIEFNCTCAFSLKSIFIPVISEVPSVPFSIMSVLEPWASIVISPALVARVLAASPVPMSSNATLAETLPKTKSLPSLCKT